MGHTKYVLNFKYIVIYKITCKDSQITNGYIGSTTDLQNRMRTHKSACTVGTKTNQKLYKFIREHGGWSNFDMIEIDKVRCYNDDTTTARIREQQWYENDCLDSTLNSNKPFDNNETRKEYDREYHNTEKRKKINAEQYKKYRDEHKEERKMWYQLNKEKIKQKKKDSKNLII